MDVAEALADEASLREAVARLGWRDASRLAAGSPSAVQAARLRGLAVGPSDSPEVLPATAAALAELLEGSATATLPASAELAPLPQATERAHGAAQLAADAITALDLAPRSYRDGRGGLQLGATTVRRIAAELHTEQAVLSPLFEWMLDLGLCSPVGDAMRPTAAGRVFGLSAPLSRWRQLADRWLAELTVEGRAGLLDDPVSHATPQTELLGLTVEGQLSELGLLLAQDDLDGASALLESALPEDVDGVYLQPDLSIIAPGPLTPADEQALQAVASLERRGLASSYRLSEASVTHALGTGLSISDVEATLSRLSLTGIPQPVEYLLREASNRHGRVRVREHPVRPGTIVTSDDPALMDALKVDAAVAPLGLRQSGEGALVSSASRDTVVLMLLDARYPASAENAEGELVPLRPRETAPPRELRPSDTALRFADALHDEATRLDAGDDAQTWVQRQLEIARRAKSEVRVRVDLGGGKETALRLVPMSVAAGRLRARDLAADVERTLPIRAILEVQVLDDPVDS
ncbi:helicase-associated domain-containing protein [Pseudoclavibacter helvolus]|uniref:helicase-associated domain-containing protein n=1 Tax=Pseudoclavibacter helvolus TaxID=255205 RepID=UPI003C778182